MKSLSRILTLILCCAPFAYANAAGTVATTSGSNLTAFNPSYSNNNQWATLSNSRSDPGAGAAKADFKNCEAIVLRCAQPRCANGGCSDMNVAAGIVNGCIQSNESCKQYGDNLISSLSAQLVASSNAKVNAQNAAAAQQAQYENQMQMQQMQAQMQQQMMQMQQQNNETVQQLQDALAQQQAQNQQAIESMRVAATEAAKSNEAGVSAYQQEAISRGVSTDVLERQKITGQIMTEIEDAEVSLKKVKASMMEAFEYAGCDSRGDNCTGPKRVAKWRELAKGFIDPYDDVINNIYDALSVSQLVGVDLSEIYMMLNDSCNSWGQYMCPKSDHVVYTGGMNGQKGTPYACPKDVDIETECFRFSFDTNLQINDERYNACKREKLSLCKPCTLLKVLTDKEAIYDGWVNTEELSTGNNTVVACASGSIETGILARRAKRTKGSGMIDLDYIERWINQKEFNTKKPDNASSVTDYYTHNCGVSDADIEQLRTATFSRKLSDYKNLQSVDSLCVTYPGTQYIYTESPAKEADECPYIRHTFGICDTHPYNIGVTDPENLDVTTKEKMQEVIGLKTTVISQQMFKQYEYLEATMRRLKTQLEKAVLTASLEAAGANSDSSSGGLAGGKSDSDKEIILPGAENCYNSTSPSSAYSCIQNNLNLIRSNISTNKQKAARQLEKTYAQATQWGIILQTPTADSKTKCDSYAKNKQGSTKADDISACVNDLYTVTSRKIYNEKNNNSGFVIMQTGNQQ